MGLEDNPFAASTAQAGDPWADADDLELLKADRFQRWLGSFIDQIVWSAPFFVAVIPPMVLDAREDLAMGLMLGGFFVSIVPCWFLPWYFIATQGQSFGKMALGMRIVRTSGEPVDFVRGVILRNWTVFAMAAVLGGLASLLDAIWIFGDKKQCLHDVFADTIVVSASAWNPYDPT